MTAAVLFGGGGRSAPIFNLFVQIPALVLLSVSLPNFRRFLDDAPRAFIGLLVFTLGLPLFHIVPLPSEIWSALPGRDLVAESLELIGRSDAWMPISVDTAQITFFLKFSLPPIHSVWFEIPN